MEERQARRAGRVLVVVHLSLASTVQSDRLSCRPRRDATPFARTRNAGRVKKVTQLPLVGTAHGALVRAIFNLRLVGVLHGRMRRFEHGKATFVPEARPAPRAPNPFSYATRRGSGVVGLLDFTPYTFLLFDRRKPGGCSVLRANGFTLPLKRRES